MSYAFVTPLLNVTPSPTILEQESRLDSSKSTGRPMRVRFLSENRPGPRMGMGHYERLLLGSLSARADPNRWQFDIVFGGRSHGTALDLSLIGGQVTTARFMGFSAGRLQKWPWAAAKLALRIGTGVCAPDLYHSLALSYPSPGGRPTVYTIHDLPPAHFPDEGSLPFWAKRAVAEADAIVTPSAFAKRELLGLLDLPPAKVVVVQNGCEHDRFHRGVVPTDPGALAKLGIPGPFLLYVGGATHRKNVTALLRAWEAISCRYPDLTLALAGPDGPLRRLVADTKASRVTVLGYVDRDSLPGILRAAVALVCPSIYEGFGLPPLEAMASGIPVVAVDAGAIPEVADGHAILAADGSPEAIGGAIRQLLDDPDRAAELGQTGPSRAAQFSWTAHADRLLDVYADVLKTKV